MKLLFKFSSRQKTTTVLKQRPHVKIQDIKKTYVLNILVIEQFLLDNIKKGISAACFCGWEEMTMEYKEKIIEMVNEIDRKDILRYIYIIISDIMKEEKEREKNGSK